jgi:hypothetical protein
VFGAFIGLLWWCLARGMEPSATWFYTQSVWLVNGTSSARLAPAWAAGNAGSCVCAYAGERAKTYTAAIQTRAEHGQHDVVGLDAINQPTNHAKCVGLSIDMIRCSTLGSIEWSNTIFEMRSSKGVNGWLVLGIRVIWWLKFTYGTSLVCTNTIGNCLICGSLRPPKITLYTMRSVNWSSVISLMIVGVCTTGERWRLQRLVVSKKTLNNLVLDIIHCLKILFAQFLVGIRLI